MQQHLITLFCICITVGAYIFFRALYRRFNHPLLNVVVLSAAAVICILLLLDIPYEDYVPAQEIITVLIGPATVGLAVPLYRYRRLLVSSATSIITSVAVGSLLAMSLASGIAAVGGLPEEVVMSILPKGVSIPFAVEVAGIFGGIPALAAAFVVATGTLGSLLGAWTLNLFRIKDPMGRGLALGTVSHAQGTAVALEEGDLPGAMAGLAMILAGLFTAALSPLVVPLLRWAVSF